MAAASQTSILETLLAAIPGDSPGGSALPDKELFQIEQARHSDDGGGDVWKREVIEPDWPQIRQLTAAAIAAKSKSLKLAAWHVEAAARLDSLDALPEGFDLLAGLIERFWDKGLLPGIDDGDCTYRASPIEGLNHKISALLQGTPLTKRSGSGANYCLPEYDQSLKAGLEKNLRDKSGNLDGDRKRIRDRIVAAEGVTGEMWEAAVKSTKRAFYETLATQLGNANDSLTRLRELMDEPRFFGPTQAPSVQKTREALEAMQSLVQHILKDKRKEEPDPPPTTLVAGQGAPQESAIHGSVFAPSGGSALGTSWERAEHLVNSGNLHAGLEEMTALASQEHGRNRFVRRLALAEVCLKTQQNAIAVIILEELSEQINSLNLTNWESAELICRVWGQLYRQYHKAGDEKKTMAVELYLKLCRLDPWQGLRWAAH